MLEGLGDERPNASQCVEEASVVIVEPLHGCTGRERRVAASPAERAGADIGAVVHEAPRELHRRLEVGGSRYGQREGARPAHPIGASVGRVAVEERHAVLARAEEGAEAVLVHVQEHRDACVRQVAHAPAEDVQVRHVVHARGRL
jgi:hypothetical protein